MSRPRRGSGEAVGVERLAVCEDRVVEEEIPIERKCRNGSFFQEPKESVAVFGGRRHDAHAQLRVAWPPRCELHARQIAQGVLRDRVVAFEVGTGLLE